MKRLGHRYRQEGATDQVPAEENRRYGIQDTSRAAAYGYRPYSVANPPKPDTQASPYTRSEWASLTGSNVEGKELPAGTKSANGEIVPQGGCRGEADRTVRTPFDYPAGVSAARAIYFEGFKKSLADPSVEKAFEEWSACMADKNYDYASPLAAMGSSEFTQGEITARERAVAQADISCKKKVRLVARWNAVESRIEKYMMREKSAILAELLRRQKAKIDAAQNILEE
ncbi:hypothetical protein [Streptomyces dubilierae]|uniref:Uncharacterized protein n=1 Tax=Streptomyces dubilierae TaxID=3075533 RepID=A0ABU2PAM8_9ACTN|nr:hypothetical protein [Streptomyces sp. DSM 41921]MDT0389198.1 hypothetical protein [Streptomyces sp. DSM 41921]